MYSWRCFILSSYRQTVPRPWGNSKGTYKQHWVVSHCSWPITRTKFVQREAAMQGSGKERTGYVENHSEFSTINFYWSLVHSESIEFIWHLIRNWRQFWLNNQNRKVFSFQKENQLSKFFWFFCRLLVNMGSDGKLSISWLLNEISWSGCTLFPCWSVGGR